MGGTSEMSIEKARIDQSASAPVRFSPPKRLLTAHIYQQPPDCHPGRSPGDHRPVKQPSRLTRGIELVELVIGGRGWVQIEDDLLEVTPGALLWHVEGDETISRSDWNNPYSCLAVVYETVPFQGIRRTSRLAWWREPEEIQKFANEVLDFYLDESFDRDVLLHYTYGRLLLKSRSCWQNGIHSQLPPKLREALRLIKQSYVSSMALDELAERIGWTLPHLHQVFRRELGTTPHQYILSRRIKTAKDKLALGHDSIKEIAIDCGFASPAAFCHSFKVYTGMTPLNYRKKEQQRFRV